MDKAKNIFLKAGNFVKTKASSLSRKAVIGILSVTAAIIVSIVILSVILGQTRYTVLYAGVSNTEASEIITYATTTMGLPISDIKLDKNNGNILINEKRAEEARVALAMANYPTTGYNYDIWKNGVTMFSTKTEMREIQRQQLEVNLSNTLKGFDNVDSAAVKESSAGITLRLKDNLKAEAIDGMYNLVARSVPGLKRTNITITDSTGVQLSPEMNSSFAEEESEKIQIEYQKMAFQQKMREQYEESIRSVMANIFDDINVAVGLTLNYDNKVSEVTTYWTENRDENGNMIGIVSDETFKNAFGGIAQEGGVVGTFINSDISPDYPTLTVGEGDQFYSETERILNYKINETKEQIEGNGVKIDHLSASVVAKSNNALTNDEETRWRQIIADAIGADIANVHINTTPFIETTNPGVSSDGLGITNISSESMALLAIIIVLGIILIVLLILALNAPGARKKRRAANMAVKGAPATAGAGADNGEDFGFERVENHAPAVDNTEFELASLSDETTETREEALKREIQDFSKNNPEIVAQLIRTWIRGEE